MSDCPVTEAAARLEAATTKITACLEEARLEAEQDRIQIARLILLTQRLLEQGSVTLHGTQRMERAAEAVASDLAASVERADRSDTATPGSGADAALRSAP